jgi:hypothetical protein
MSDVVLGQLITGDVERDAIHIAVAPMTAASRLEPGWRIGFNGNGEAIPANPGVTAIGIVDPFLQSPVPPGEKFYVMLFQNTIVGMRHHWEHPAFTEARRAASERWLRSFCDSHDCPDYDTVVAAASGSPISAGDEYGQSYSNQYGYITFYGRDAHCDIPNEFWHHIEVVTGIEIPSDKRARAFSCSC